MEVSRPNQVWAMDITYVPMAKGFVYLAVSLWLPHSLLNVAILAAWWIWVKTLVPLMT
jgi:hypothetical protein